MLFGGTAAVVSASLLALYVYQNKIVYPSWAEGAREHVDTPDKYGLPYEERRLVTADGIEIRTYDIRRNDSDASVLILCPNAGNIGFFLPIVELLFKTFKLSVFIYSYRGYGYSKGSPSEKGLKLDADCVMSFIKQDPFYKTQRLILYGRSLGGANAIYIARKYAHLCDAVILENTFLSIPKVVPHIFPWLKYLSFMCHEIWNSENEIPGCDPTMPFLFLSGLRDEIVPPSHMERLYQLCPSEHKTFFAFPRGYHNDTIAQDGYWEVILDFLDKYDLCRK